MHDLINDQSVWTGNQLLDRPDWLIELKNGEISELQTTIGASESISTDDINQYNFPLPNLAPRLVQIRHSLENGSGATLIRGFPLDRFTEAQSTRAFFAISQHIGTAISQSATGERIFHVCDAGFQENDPRGRGPNTKKRLSFHTDRCDVIGFMCLKQARSGGENSLVSSTAIYNEIAQTRPNKLETLKQPFIYKRHNVDLGNESAYCRQPVFSFTEGRFACSFLRVLIDRAYASGEVPPMTEVQKEALDFLEATCEREDLQYRFYQRPGDMLFLNNWTTLHRRSEFVDHDDPALKRHLLRIWLSVPNSRPIDPLFKDNFGATEAGAIRGGMRAMR